MTDLPIDDVAAGMQWVIDQGRAGLLLLDPQDLRQFADALDAGWVPTPAAFAIGIAAGLRIAAAAIEAGEAPW